MGIYIGENKELRELLDDNERCAVKYGKKPVVRVTSSGNVIIVSSGGEKPQYLPSGNESLGSVYNRLQAIRSRVDGVKCSPHNCVSGLEVVINKARKALAADRARDKLALEISSRGSSNRKVGGFWQTI